MVKLIFDDNTEAIPEFLSVKIEEKLAHGVTDEIGAIVVQEAEVQIDNTDGTYSPDNSNSPYYGKIKTGIKLVVDGVEYIVTEISAPRTEVTAKIRGQDELSLALDTPVYIPYMTGINVSEIIQGIAAKLGLSPSFKTTVNIILNHCYIKKPLVDVLKQLSVAGNVFFRSNNRVLEIGSLQRGDAEVELSTYENTAELHAMDIEAQTFKVVYYPSMYLAEQTEHGSVDYTLLPKGETTLTLELVNHEFVMLETKDNVTVEVERLDNGDVMFRIRNNTDNVIEGSAKLYSKEIKFTKMMIDNSGSNEVDSIFIQSRPLAEMVSRRFNEFYRLPRKLYQFRAMLPQRLKAGDFVSMRSAYIDDMGLVIDVSQTYAGGYWTAQGKVIRPVSEYKPVFLAPYFCIDVAV